MAKLIAKDENGQIPGIFSNNTVKQQDGEEINTPEQEQISLMVEADYYIFKSKRQPLEEVWRKEQRMAKGDHWYGMRPPDNSQYPERMEYVGNYAWSQIESVLSRLTGWVPTPEFEATEPNDEDKANLLNTFIPYELNQIKFKPKHVRAVRRMVIHGTLLYKVIFDPKVEGGRGMNRWNGQNDIIPLNYGCFFPDPAVKDFIYLQSGRAHIINNLLTIQYIRERWPKQGMKVMPDSKSNDTEIFDIDDVTSVGTLYNQTNNLTTTNVIEYWYKGIPKYMSDEDIQLFKGLAEDELKEGKDPSVNLAKSKGTMKGIHCIYVTTSRVFLEHKSYVFDHGQYPIIARTLFPEENNPWGKGYMRDLIPPQNMYNRFCELAIDITAKMGNSAIVYSTTTGLTEAFKNIWKRMRGQAGAMLPVSGDVNQVKELQGVAPNPGIFQYIQHFIEMMQKIPGIFDSTNGAANSDVNSGEQAKALIDASQGRLSTAAELIEDAVQECVEQYVELCAQLYPTERVARIAGKQVSFSRSALLSQAQTEYSQDGASIPVVEEYVPKFDVKVNIGVEKPKDRQYYVSMAFQMFQTIDPTTQMPLIDAQAVKFTVENGFMEPMSIIEERMQSEQKQLQMIQQLQQKIQQDDQEIQVLQQEVEQLHGHLSDAEQHNMQGHAEALQAADASQAQEHEQQLKVAQLVQSASQQTHQQQIDKAKVLIDAAKVQQMGQKQVVGAK